MEAEADVEMELKEEAEGDTEAGGEAEVSTAALADTRWVERRDAGEDAGA